MCKIAIVDFYLPELNTVIQCDGCYWHGCPVHFPNTTVLQKNKKKRDAKQDFILEAGGLKVHRFWEHEINQSAEECIKKTKLGASRDKAKDFLVGNEEIYQKVREEINKQIKK